MSRHSLVVTRGVTLKVATNKFVTTVAKFIQQRVYYVSSKNWCDPALSTPRSVYIYCEYINTYKYIFLLIICISMIARGKKIFFQRYLPPQDLRSSKKTLLVVPAFKIISYGRGALLLRRVSGTVFHRILGMLNHWTF